MFIVLNKCVRRAVWNVEYYISGETAVCATPSSWWWCVSLKSLCTVCVAVYVCFWALANNMWAQNATGDTGRAQCKVTNQHMLEKYIYICIVIIAHRSHHHHCTEEHVWMRVCAYLHLSVCDCVYLYTCIIIADAWSKRSSRKQRARI